MTGFFLKGFGLKLKEFVDGLVHETGLKPKEVRASLDHILQAIHKVLLAGDGLDLPPLGKIRVAEQKKKTGEAKVVYRVVLQKLNNPTQMDKPPKAKKEMTKTEA